MAAIMFIATNIGCTSEILRRWLLPATYGRRQEPDHGRAGRKGAFNVLRERRSGPHAAANGRARASSIRG
jgi:hypothetical protein